MNLYDLAYAFGLAIASPYWLVRGRARHKVLHAMKHRMGEALATPSEPSGPVVMIHAVSNGELGATTSLIQLLGDERPDLRFVISTSSESGWNLNKTLYGANPRATPIRFPLDFSSAVAKTLDTFQPALAVLMELEVWPNFLHQCRRKGIRVVLANGRITASSFRGYRLGRWLTTSMFRQLDAVCAQDQVYADRFVALGAVPDRVQVVGTMKFDTAHLGDRVEGDDSLAAAVGIAYGAEPVWVCGSTGPGEELFILDAYRQVRERHPRLRLVIVPRHTPRFDEVAELIRQKGFRLTRRSQPLDDHAPGGEAPVVLGDTMGELRKFYSLATVVFVGRSLVDLGPRQHGSDMIEPAALAKPVMVGPFTHNFAEPMACFQAAGAIRVVADTASLGAAVESFLTDATAAREVGIAAQDVVRRGQGATRRHADIILHELQLKGV